MHTNALIGESSPYLLQHAHNPVDWLPWGEAAFAKARREDRPVFLSVGYSTCHWCHVMERESFEDAETARLLNAHFVPVKVDREERPDVDRVYMAYVQAATGGGGWPMSVWLTPDLKPFLGGTYFPPEPRWGQPGFRDLLRRIAEAWQSDRAAVAAAADSIVRQLREAAEGDRAASGPIPGREVLDRAFERLRGAYDREHGGFGPAPKFPQPSIMRFLLAYHARTGAPEARDMALHTLRRLARGGIRDHLGGGFHRYSVDARWHVPHFEKMLYDQALLAAAYLDAFQLTRDPFFADVARGALDYVLRDLTGNLGQFLSAEDADSARPGAAGTRAEGAYYVWTLAEARSALEADEADALALAYGLEPGGNVREDPHGEFGPRNVLAEFLTEEEAAARLGIRADRVRRLLASARRKLFAARAARPRPPLDDKAIAAWNGLMIGTLARACQVLGEERYAAAALRAAVFARAHLRDGEGGLLRGYRGGRAAIPAYADDHAFMIAALLDLYETCFDTAWIEWAVDLQARQDSLFHDPRGGGYFSTSGRDAAILLRTKEGHDGAEPSPNAIAAMSLQRLARMTGNTAYAARADETLAAFGAALREAPEAMPAMLAALDVRLAPPLDIVVAGKPGDRDTRALLAAAHGAFAPGRVLLLADGGRGQRWLGERVPHLQGVRPPGGRAAAYVCENGACREPTQSPEDLGARLHRAAP